MRIVVACLSSAGGTAGQLEQPPVVVENGLRPRVQTATAVLSGRPSVTHCGTANLDRLGGGLWSIVVLYQARWYWNGISTACPSCLAACKGQ